MPTPAQVTGRAQPAPAERHYTATVVTAGNPLTVTLNPGGARTTAAVLDGQTYAAGARVLVLVTQFGNWVVGALGAAPTPPSYPVTDFSASFAITAAPTNPTKGNSTYQAAYQVVDKLVSYQFFVNIGTGFLPGSGSYRLNVPVPASAAGYLTAVGSVFIIDAGSTYENGTVEMVDANNLAITLKTGLFLGSTGPGTPWASGDSMRGSINYWKA